MDLPIAVSDGHQVAVVTPVSESRARTGLHLAFQMRKQVKAINVDLERLFPRCVALLELFHNVRFPGGREKCREHVLMRENLVADSARLDDTRPTNRAGYSPTAFPVGVLLAAEHCGSPIWPGHDFGTVVGGVHHNGVVGDSQFIELGEQLSDLAIMFDHAVGGHAQSLCALTLFLHMLTMC